MKMKVCYLSLVLLASSMALGQLAFDDQFENGRLDTAFQESSSYRLWPVTNLHVRVVNTANQSPVFTIFDSVGFQLRSYHHMVYSEEGTRAWSHFDTAYKSGTQSYYHFHNHLPFTADTIYIAYWVPYTYSDLQAYLSSIQSDSSVQIWSAGSSIQGRVLYGFSITDTSYLDCYKQEVVITARQHPIEHINGYFVEGMANYLLSSDSIAEDLRRRYKFLFYPMCNPDGVVNGSGQNVLGQGLNREWADSTNPGGTPEVDSIKQDIWHKTNGSFDFGIDIHSNAGSNLPYYWWGFTSSSGVDSAMLWQAQTYVQTVASLDTSSNQGGSLYQNYIQGNGVNSSMTAANWFYRSGGAVGFTFEPTTEPLGFSGDNAFNVDNYRSAGSSLARGLSSVSPLIDPMRVELHFDTNFVFIQPSGGVGSYSYFWKALNSSDSGTSSIISYPGGGLTLIRVEDSAGCVFERIVQVPPSSMRLDDFTKAFRIFPNPTSGEVKLEMDGTEGRVLMRIINTSGIVIQTFDIEDFGSEIYLELNLKSGVYIAQVVTEEGVGQEILVVE